MVEEPPKPVSSNIAVSDVLVPVDVGAERSLGVVGVDNFDVREAEHTVELCDGFLKAGSSGDVVAGGVTMAGVDAEGDFEIGDFGGELPHQREFFEAAAQRRTCAGRV